MFRIEPRYGIIRVKRCFPHKAAIGLYFHAKEGIWKAGEIVIVDACIDECSSEASLFLGVLV